MSDLDPEPFVCVAHADERRDSDRGFCGGWNRRIFRPRSGYEQDPTRYPDMEHHDYWGWRSRKPSDSGAS